MCFDALERVRRNIRQAFACVCLIACAGPAMFIVGIVFLVKKNTRDDDIKLWKSAISDYDATDALVMARTAATVNLVPLSVVTHSIYPRGDQTDVPTNVTSTRLTTSSVSVAASYDIYIAVSGATDNASTNITVTAPTSKLTSTSVKCTKSYCTSSCSSSDYRCGSIGSSACSSGTYSGQASCYAGDSCGTCTRTEYIINFCTPLALSGGNTSAVWQTSSIGTACAYPYSEQIYSTAYASSIAASVMSDNDPYVSLQRITEGSSDFGMTKEDQHKIGVGLLVAGIVVAVLVYGCLAAALYYFCFRNKDGASGSSPGEPAHFSGAGPAAGSAPVKVQPGAAPTYPSQFSVEPSYPSPQPAPYGQPQPAPYGPPQPAPYGQPQPAPYGQPQPAPYGQPQPAPYGQPQPTPYGQPIPYGQPMQPAPALYGAPAAYGQPAPYGAPPAGPSVAAFGMPPPQA